MPKPESKYVRDVEGIALARGVKLVKQRKRRLAQLDEVRGWLADPSFPRKQKNGMWLRKEVVDWQMGVGRKEMGKNDEVPTPAAGLEQGELDSIIARFSPAYQLRLRGLYAKWLDPQNNSLKDSELKELRAAGLVRDESTGKAVAGKPAPVEIPDYVSQAQLAEILSELYNVPVYPMMVSRAINEEGMPGRQKNQSIKTSLAIPWWEDHKVKRETQGGLFQQAQEAELRKKIDDAKRAARELELFEQANSDKFLPRDQVERFITGLGRSNSVMFTQLLEKEQHRDFCADLEAISMADEVRLQVRAAHLQRCRRTNDECQRRFGTDGEHMKLPEKENETE